MSLLAYYNKDILEVGIDEAGRGPLFGRVYIGAVILPQDDSFNHSLMRDSKKLNERTRLIAFDYIKEYAIDWVIHYKDENYIDKNLVKFEHHAFPLDLAALNAEKIVRCGSSPDARFKLLTKIYDKQTKWAVGSDIKKINNLLLKISGDSKLSEGEFRKCLEDEKTQELILKERIEAQKEYNITSTPTIYINNKKYEDKHEFKSYKREIDKLL